MTVPGLRYQPDKVPRDYQVVDAAYLQMYPRSVLAEYPGAGKKLIAEMATLKLFSRMMARQALIISLGSDADQWVEDLHTDTEGCTIQLYRGTKDERRRMAQEEVDFRVTTYQTATNDVDLLIGRHEIIILDETSFLKNPGTNAHFNLRALCAPTLQEQANYFRQLHEELHPNVPWQGWRPQGIPAAFVWGLTATPMETGPMDIFSLYWAIQGAGSVLGVNDRRFKREFCIVQTFRMRLPARRGRRGKMIRIEKVAGCHPHQVPLLKERIGNQYMRHPWERIEEFLPELDVIPIWVELGKKQRDRYAEIANGDVIYDYLQQELGRRVTSKEVTAGVRLHYLMRCVDGLQSLPGQRYRDSIKKQRCLSLLNELGTEPVFVFSRFHQPLDELQRELDDRLISWVRIDGNHTDEENTAARRIFQAGNTRVLLATAKASYALNLQIAHYGIAYNCLYNPKKLDQLYGRIRRSGGYDHVIWYHLLTKDTVEEAQWQTLRDREALFRDIFGLSEELFQSLTPSEQEEMIHFGHGQLR